jgi:hypothetical protein
MDCLVTTNDSIVNRDISNGFGESSTVSTARALSTLRLGRPSSERREPRALSRESEAGMYAVVATKSVVRYRV